VRNWKCTVCGNIHIGDEPPDECPECEADRCEFVEISGIDESPSGIDAEVPAEEPVKAETSPLLARLTGLMLQNHAHQIAVHTPNGIIPAAVVFLLLALLLNLSSLELAAFYNQVFVLLVMPVVLLSGIIEWQKHYNGARTSVFMLKIGCGIVVLVSILFLVIWRLANPAVASPESPVRWIYFLVNMIALGAAGLAGHLGGKLVFGRRKR
jgi:uncharacterized membrane protein